MCKNPQLKLALLFGALGALWRRWFGGGFKKFLPDSRFWKYLVLTFFVFSVFWIFDLFDWYSVQMYLVTLGFMLHWAEGHGDYYYVWDTGKDEGRIRWIDWTLRLLYGKDNYYNFKGNVTGLLLRYTSTACLVSLFLWNPWFILAGPLTTLSYVLTSKLPRPTDWAEFLAGCLNFLLLYLCIGGYL